MLELTAQEKKDRRTAMLVSIALHILLVLLLFYIMAWRAPNPPLEDYGIEVNFGTDAIGGGDVQTKAVANESPNREDSKPATTSPEPAEPEIKPQPTITQAVPEQVVTAENNNPVAFKKEEVKEKPEPPKEEVKAAEKPKTIYSPKANTAESGNGTAGTSNKPTGNSNGDNDGKTGDKGDPEGKPDAKNLYGKPGGGGGGPSLQMPGWRYDVRPKEDPYANESGVVKFQITIDSNGEIENVKVIESNVSPQVVKWYRDEVYKTSFSRTDSKAAQDRGATGFITFIIRSR